MATNNVNDATKFTNRELGLLGLNEHPFRISADPRFLYLADQYRGALLRLQDSIAWREGLSVIEGPIGSGKTTLARRLFELCNQEENVRPVYIHTARYNTPLDAMRDFADTFRQPPRRSYTSQIRQFEEFLLSLREQNINPVLIIDDAQMMGHESLQPIQDLLNFDLSSKLIQIILFGQQEIHGNFARIPSLLDRVILWHKLGPFTYTDMVRMIQFRLAVAGRREPLFTDQGMELLFNFSKGIPRPLIIVCNETLRVLIKSGRFEADKAEIQQAIDIYNQRPRSEND